MSSQRWTSMMAAPDQGFKKYIDVPYDALEAPCAASAVSSFTEQPPTPTLESSFRNCYSAETALECTSSSESCSGIASPSNSTATSKDQQHASPVGSSPWASCNERFCSSHSSSGWSLCTCSSNDSNSSGHVGPAPFTDVRLAQRFADAETLPSNSSGQQLQHCRKRLRQSSLSNSVVQLAAVLASCLGWVGMSSAAILINKHCMVDLGFHFPAAVAALGMIGTTLFSFLACTVLRLVPCQAAVSPYFFATRILSTAFFTALSFQAGNTAYLYLSVAFVQMLKAFTPVSTMLCGFLFKLERPSVRLIAAVSCICCGVVVSSYGELNFSVFGVSAMIVSIAAEGLRIVMMQHLLESKQFHPIEAWLYLGPACCIWLVVLIGVFEIHHIKDAHGLDIIAAHPSQFAFAAGAGFAVNALAMSVIKLASALTLKVLGICKDIGLVTFGVLLLGEHVTGLQGCGYSLSLLGFGCYNYIKMREGQAAPGADSMSTQLRQQQKSVLITAGSKSSKLPRTPSPLRRKPGLIGTATVVTEAPNVTSAQAAALQEREPLLSHVQVKVLA